MLVIRTSHFPYTVCVHVAVAFGECWQDGFSTTRTFEQQSAQPMFMLCCESGSVAGGPAELAITGSAPKNFVNDGKANWKARRWTQ